MWVIPDDVPLFQMLTVAKAAGVAPATIRAWFQRKHVRLNGTDSAAPANGLPNKFTLRSVLMLAVTAELVRLGSGPADAFRCAEFWMRNGVVEGQEGAVGRREAGGLFGLPRSTYLVVGADGWTNDPAMPPCRIEGIDQGDPDAHSAFFRSLFFRGRPSAKIVWLDMVDRRVRQACYESVLGAEAPPEPNWDAVAAEIIAGES